MGDANASIPTVQPVLPRPMWGANPASAALNSVSFVSQVSIELGMTEIDPLSAAVRRNFSSRYHKGIQSAKACRGREGLPHSKEEFNEMERGYPKDDRGS
jgi:hypothetical protein